MNKRAVIAAVIPLLLVNIVAFSGQLAFIRDHMSWPLIGDIMFAAALESIAIYVAYHAHIALISNDSALRLRFGSYAIGLLIGIMNYSHYANNWRPTFEAVAVGTLSALSPVLWGIHSRRVSRDKLLAAGLIEPHAVRLGVTRWLWHPKSSFRVMQIATWSGEQNPQTAITAYEVEMNKPEPAAKSLGEQIHDAEHCDHNGQPHTGPCAEPVDDWPDPGQEPEPEPEPGQEPAALPEPALPAALPAARRGPETGSKAALVRAALHDAPDSDTAAAIAARLAERGVSVSAAYVRQVRSLAARRTVETRRSTMHALTPGASSEHARDIANQDK